MEENEYLDYLNVLKQAMEGIWDISGFDHENYIEGIDNLLQNICRMHIILPGLQSLAQKSGSKKKKV